VRRFSPNDAASERHSRHREPGAPTVTIGLVNNMPDGALEYTARQFAELLRAAEQRVAARVRFRVFSIPEVPRGARGRAYVAEHCEDIGALWREELDGLIVTGLEPRAPTLVEEPYWAAFAELVDWARERTRSAIWSCLAAHAAVYRLDGVTRQRRPTKLLGVFECAKASDHAMVADMPAKWRVPHSRYNDLPQEALVASGYEILAKSREAGADMFVKSGQSLFVFFQGHPEYDPESLLLEYQRDVGRFLRGEREDYPAMPCEYFDARTQQALDAFREAATKDRSPERLAEFPVQAATLSSRHSWRDSAVRMYVNWLSQLVDARHESAGYSRSHEQA
jgi:homoserine O-succinyltransferase